MTIIFVHIPKTAGTTLSNIIRRLYRRDQILLDYPRDSGESAYKQFERRHSLEFEVIMGHFPFGKYLCTNHQPTYLTILRHPIERVVSHYHFVQRSPRHYLYRTVIQNRMTLKDYIISGISTEMDNGQTRMLCNPVAMNVPFGLSTDEMLDEAKYNLANNIKVVGLTEEFDQTVILMKRQLKWGWPYYVVKNRTSDRPNIRQVTSEVLQIIEEYNRLDMALYSYAEELFEAKIQKEGEDFEREVNQFKWRNALVGRFVCRLADASRLISRKITKL